MLWAAVGSSGLTCCLSPEFFPAKRFMLISINSQWILAQDVDMLALFFTTPKTPRGLRKSSLTSGSTLGSILTLRRTKCTAVQWPLPPPLPLFSSLVTSFSTAPATSPFVKLLFGITTVPLCSVVFSISGRPYRAQSFRHRSRISPHHATSVHHPSRLGTRLVGQGYSYHG